MAKNLMDNFSGSRWTGAVAKIGSAGAVGTPEDFEKHFERKNRPKQTPQAPRPTLTPVENRSLQERMDDLGLETHS